MRVAIVDSGVERDHPAVGGRLVESVAVERVGDDWQVVPTRPNDVVGHGTACAGIIHALAPEADIVSIRVLGPDNRGNGGAFAAGLWWAITEAGASVANLSLSSRSDAYFGPLHELADEAYFRNVLLVSAANNVSVASYPSLFAAVVSVAAHDVPDPDAWFYNPEPPVEFGGYGLNVDVAWRGGTRMVVTGNSFAAPHIAGLRGADPGRASRHHAVRDEGAPRRHGRQRGLSRRRPGNGNGRPEGRPLEELRDGRTSRPRSCGCQRSPCGLSLGAALGELAALGRRAAAVEVAFDVVLVDEPGARTARRTLAPAVALLGSAGLGQADMALGVRVIGRAVGRARGVLRAVRLGVTDVALDVVRGRRNPRPCRAAPRRSARSCPGRSPSRLPFVSWARRPGCPSPRRRAVHASGRRKPGRCPVPHQRCRRGDTQRRGTSTPSSRSSACFRSSAASTPPQAATPYPPSGPVAGDHPVARDEQADRVAAHRPADGSGRTRPADPPRDLAVARGRATGDRPHAVEDEPIPGRAVADVDRDRGEVGIAPVEQVGHGIPGAVGEVCAPDPLRRPRA